MSRNELVREAVAEGRQIKDVAAEFGVSPQRVNQIVDPHKGRARVAVRDALRRGDLRRPTECQECGSVCFPEAHHEDYGAPLDVEWLCVPCHKDRHREDERRGTRDPLSGPPLRVISFKYPEDRAKLLEAIQARRGDAYMSETVRAAADAMVERYFPGATRSPEEAEAFARAQEEASKEREGGS